MNLDVLLLTAYWSWRCNPSQVKLQANVFILSTLNKQAVCKVYESSVEGWDSHGLRVFICPECELKNPIPVSTSLTLSSCYDLRCSFDLNMFWWVSEWNGMRLCVYVMGSGGRGGVTLWCCNAKFLLSLVERLRPGRLFKNSIRNTVNVCWQHKRRREAQRCEGYREKINVTISPNGTTNWATQT